jgi:chitinase
MKRYKFINDKINRSSLIVSYFAPSILTNDNLDQMSAQLNATDVLNYSFASLDGDKIYLNETSANSINILNQWRFTNLKPNGEPAFALVLSIGGWGDRTKFTDILTIPGNERRFIASIEDILEKYNLDGIDLDWENEIIATKEEIAGAGTVLNSIRTELGNSYYITIAAPGTPFYWDKYPHAKIWKDSIDWMIVMGYDQYGTFGPYAECASNLYPVSIGNISDNIYDYPYPQTISVSEAMEHYHSQGVPVEKLVMGVPFYAHMYYIKQLGKYNGLRQKVYDSNICSQYTPDIEFFEYMGKNKTELEDGTVWATRKILAEPNKNIYEFYSAETVKSIKTKAKYVKNKKFAGMSMWELSQDVSHESAYSLLKAMYKGLNNFA